ncbi:hypothetical protein R4526_06460 [Acinetobacter baumannii]|nr:hypothetical protein [Acinetobacter baumannii]
MNEVKFERDIQNLSFLVPARIYHADFDITKKVPIPALIESCIKVISEVNTISPRQIQVFFGLNEVERETLINQVLNTGWVVFNENGELEATKKLLEWSNNSSDLEFVETLAFSEKIVVDLLTNHIQPRSEMFPFKGLPKILHSDVNRDDMSIDNLFSNQFTRFKDCTNNTHVKHPRSNLYRIRSIKSLRVSEIILGIKFTIKHDDYKGYHIDGKLLSHNENNGKLISSSGLYSQIIDYISNLPKSYSYSLSFQNYCDITKDHVLKDYYNYEENYFDILKFLNDRQERKTGYGNQETSALIGPIYMEPNNRLKNYLYSLNEDESLPLAIWKPANSSLFGASANLKFHIESINEILKKKGSEIITLFPYKDKSQNYQMKESFKNRIGSAYFINTLNDLDEAEVLVIPGENGFAYCQYHVTLDPDLGFPGLTIPIGYYTRDPERINILWEYLRKFYVSSSGLRIIPFSTSFESNVDSDKIYKQLIEYK